MTAFEQLSIESHRIANVIRIRRALGCLLTFNFMIFWLLPIIVQGQSWRHGLCRVFRPIYRLIDERPAWRQLATGRVYRLKSDSAYFTGAVLCAFGMLMSVGVMFGVQISNGGLPWWLIALYYFIWVGPGGRMMGVGYTLAHREGHRPGGKLYQPSVGKWIGNTFENRLGLLFGVVPYNFSTSHILLHHRLDGGKGDPIFLWDIDRTKFGDLMLYQWRVFCWMTGFSSLAEFRRQSGVLPAVDKAHATLRSGMIIYYVLVPFVIVSFLVAAGSTLGSSLLFLLFVFFQPLLAMSTFLAFINVGQHGFLEFDSEGKHIRLVTATTILDGYDDSYGEDYHFAHHFAPVVPIDKLKDNIMGEQTECARVRGSVFKETTIFEIAIMLHLGQFKELCKKHYVEFADDSSAEFDNVDELAELFKNRAKRREMSYGEYEFAYLPKLRKRVRKLVEDGICQNENQAYIYQANRIMS